MNKREKMLDRFNHEAKFYKFLFIENSIIIFGLEGGNRPLKKANIITFIKTTIKTICIL